MKKRKIFSSIFALTLIAGTSVCLVACGAPREGSYAGNPFLVDSAKALVDTLKKIPSDDLTYVKMTNNIQIDLVIENDRYVNLDLNGFSLTSVAGDTITNKGNLILEDSSTKSTGIVKNNLHGKAVLKNEQNGYLKIKSGNFIREVDSAVNTNYVFENKGIAIIENCKMTTPNSNSSLIYNGWANPEENKTGVNANLTIHSGTYSGGQYIENSSYGRMTIFGGDFSSKGKAIIKNANYINIKNANIHANSCESLFILCGRNYGEHESYYNKSIIDINRCIVSGEIVTSNHFVYLSGDEGTGVLNGEKNIIYRDFNINIPEIPQE